MTGRCCFHGGPIPSFVFGFSAFDIWSTCKYIDFN